MENNKNKKQELKLDLLALIAGVLLPFSFAPYDIIPIVFVSPAILFFICLKSKPKRAVLRGYLFGVGFFGLGVSWVAVSMYRFGGVAMPFATVLTSVFVLIWATIPAFAVFIAKRFFEKYSLPVQLLVIYPCVWVLSEWIRSWLFTGFPWLAIGYSQVDGPLYGLAPILGVYGISWCVVFIAGLMVLISQTRSTIRVKYAIVLAFSLGMPLILGLVNWTQPFGQPRTVSLIQANIAQDQKWRPEQRQPTINLYTQLTRQNWASDLIVWPETALPAYYHQAQSFLQALGEEARNNKTDLLIGLPVSDTSDSSIYFNSIVSVGEHEAFYHKQHLVPFGEFLPLKTLLGGLLDFFQIPMANFSRGDVNQKPLQVAGMLVGISICYEDAFGEEVIRGMPMVNALVNVSNDSWFGDSFAPHQHLQMARMRALETGRPMLRATNNGVSAIIDHRGNLLKQSPQFQQTVLSGQFQPMQGQTIYGFIGNSVIIIVPLLLLLSIFIYARRTTSV